MLAYASDLYRTCATGGTITNPRVWYSTAAGSCGDLRGVWEHPAGERFTAGGRKRWSIHQQAGSMALGGAEGTPWRPEAGCWLPSENRSAAYGGNGGSVFSRLKCWMLLSVLTGLFSGRTGPDTHGETQPSHCWRRREMRCAWCSVMITATSSSWEKGKQAKGLEPGLWFAHCGCQSRRSILRVGFFPLAALI